MRIGPECGVLKGLGMPLASGAEVSPLFGLLTFVLVGVVLVSGVTQRQVIHAGIVRRDERSQCVPVSAFGGLDQGGLVSAVTCLTNSQAWSAL